MDRVDSVIKQLNTLQTNVSFLKEDQIEKQVQISSKTTGADIEKEMKKVTSKVTEIAKNDIRHLESRINELKTAVENRKATQDADFLELETRLTTKNKQRSEASITQQVTKLENTQDRQGKLQQLIKHTHTTILDILCNSIQFKSFHEFTREPNKKFPYDVIQEYFEE